MALEHVQSRGALSSGPVTSLALAFLSNLTGGNMIVVHGGRQTQTGTMSVSDTRGHSFSAHANNPGNAAFGGASHAMWWNVNITAGADTVTFTCGATVVAAITISEYSGQETSGQPDTFESNSSFNNPATSTNITTSANCNLVASVVTDNTTTFTPGSPAVQRYENEGGAQDPCFAVEDRVNEPAGTYALTWTIDDVGYSVLIAAFKQAIVLAPGAEAATIGQFDADVIPRNWF